MKKKVNKVLKPVTSFFKLLWNLIDKYIITPITKLVVLVVKNNTSGAKKLEKLFSSTNALIIVSLLSSLLVFFIVDARANAFLESSAEVIYNQPVNAIYNEEAYVVEGLPETVDITLIGRSSDLYLAKQLPTHGVSLDLTGLSSGTHKVSIKYTQSVNSINYKLDPSTATIIIYPKIAETRILKTDVLNQDNLDQKLVLEDIVVDRDNAIIKGAEHILEKVANVKALIDIDNIVDPREGELELKNIPLIAYDEKGNVVDVELVPAKVNATINIKSPQKGIPVKVIPTGSVASGKAIDTVIVNETNVIIYGNEEAIDKINFLPVSIDVEGLTSSREYNITVEKPVGVNETSVTNLTITVTLADEITKEFERIAVTPINLGSGLTVLGLSESDAFVDVIVKGTEQSLETIDASGIKAEINLQDLGVGDHEVEVTVTGSDTTVSYNPKVKKVSVKISN